MDLFAGVKQLMKKERRAHVREIAKLDAALVALGDGTGRRSRRKMSTAARKRIGDATRARWAKLRASKRH
jgi:hypothetical protein